MIVSGNNCRNTLPGAAKITGQFRFEIPSRFPFVELGEFAHYYKNINFVL